MKSYVKPELFYESFEMNQSIAACGIDVTDFNDATICSQRFDEEFWPGLGGQTIFNEQCDVQRSVIEVYCYTAGTSEAGRVFQS